MSRWRSAGSARVVAVAADPATAWIVFWLLGACCLTSRSLARVLAGNARLPRPLLWWLAPHRWDVRAAVAANPRCPQLLLRLMSWPNAWAVSAAVAGNPAASGRLLDWVFRVSGPRVRLYLAGNPALPSTLADRLLGDTDPFVRGAAAAHPAATPGALSRLADGMTEPAWTLTRIAANPSCPAGLSDQLLTWIALAGAGKADPMFDPVECTGHPADTSVPVSVWYRGQASHSRAVRHPLWRVRAEALSATGRVSSWQAHALARDPRPEVRRSIARAKRLPLEIRMELGGDADPVAARLARAPRQIARRVGAPAPQLQWILFRMVRLLVRLMLIAVLISIIYPAFSPGPAGLGVQLSVPAVFTRGLPGGDLTCAALTGDPPSVLTVTASAQGQSREVVVSVGRCGS